MIKYSVLMAVYIKDNPIWFSYSIDSLLNQTIIPDEIVIVKDGPVSIEIDEVLNEKKKLYNNFNIISLEKNVGLGETLKIGVLKCKNEIIVRMDSDDISTRDRCEKQIKYMIEKKVDIVGCNIAEFYDNINNISSLRCFPENHNDICTFGKRRTPFAHPGVVFKKSNVLKVGNYSSAYLHEDYDLFVRLLMEGYIGYNVQEILVYMRVSDNFYARRGGYKYLKNLLKFNKKMYYLKWTSLKDFLVRSIANIISCLSPNFIRNFIYKKFLRKKIINERN